MTTEMRHGTGFLFFVAALPPAHDTGGAGFGFGHRLLCAGAKPVPGFIFR
jgi:hypothetical protein